MNDMPFVHLMKSPYCYYVFDVNTNSIVRVSKELYEYLLDEQQGRNPLSTVEIEREKTSLMEKGYLKTKHPQKMESPYIPKLKYLSENHMQMLTLQVTQQCNFRCSYCPYTLGDDYTQRSHSSKRMSWETAKAAIDFWAERITHSNKVDIGFYGGEPLLEWPLIKKCIEYAKMRTEGKEVTFSMTTNATLLTREIAETIVKERMQVLISLDGPPEIHDRNRRFHADGRGTFSTIMETLQKMSEEVEGFAETLRFNSVIDPCNSPACISNFFKEIKQENVTPSNLEPPPGTRLSYSKQYMREFNRSDFYGYLSLMGIVRDDQLDMFSNNFARSYSSKRDTMIPFSELPDITSHSGPCLAGIKRLFVDVDGTFFPCEKCSESSGSMRLGDIKTGLDLERVKGLINIAALTENRCKNCWAMLSCNICAAQMSGVEELSAKTVLPLCAGSRSSAELQLKQFILMEEVSEMARAFREREGKQ